jgi:hypothetical protein
MATPMHRHAIVSFEIGEFGAQVVRLWRRDHAGWDRRHRPP